MTTTKKKKPQIATEFENRICVFLDILGFRDHLARAATDPGHVKRISEAFACFNENLKQGNGILYSRQYSQYSDCVTLSCRIDEPSSVYYLLSELLEIQIALAGRGFLVRGGVTVGQLVHDEEQLFGPAQVRAFELESKEAIYPRILVDEQVVEIGRSCPAPHHDADDEEGYLRSIISEDFDGRLCIGYTTYKSIVDVVGVEPDEYAPYMAEVIKIVEQGLQSKDAPTLAKNLWLYGKYLEAREHIRPEFHDTHFPNTLLPIAQKAYQAVLAHVENRPTDEAKCALPQALADLLGSSKVNRATRTTGGSKR